MRSAATEDQAREQDIRAARSTARAAEAREALGEAAEAWLAPRTYLTFYSTTPMNELEISDETWRALLASRALGQDALPLRERALIYFNDPEEAGRWLSRRADWLDNLTPLDAWHRKPGPHTWLRLDQSDAGVYI